MQSETLPDKRALAFPDEPYSAYCRVCWHPYYRFWVTKDDHHNGECVFQHKSADQCPNAMGRERMTAQIRKYKQSIEEHREGG